MTITYTQIGDYLLPNLIPPESPKVGRWGMLRYSYLRNHREVIYAGMLMKGTLNAHLEEVDQQANEMEQQPISQLAQREGVDMPICRSIYEVLYHGMAVQDVVSGLMRRAKKDELTETTWL